MEANPHLVTSNYECVKKFYPIAGSCRNLLVYSLRGFTASAALRYASCTVQVASYLERAQIRGGRPRLIMQKCK